MYKNQARPFDESQLDGEPVMSDDPEPPSAQNSACHICDATHEYHGIAGGD
jgi:hypothetical protein